MYFLPGEVRNSNSLDIVNLVNNYSNEYDGKNNLRDLPFSKCSDKDFFSCMSKTTIKKRKLTNAEKSRIAFNELPFFKCSDYEIIMMCMTAKEKILQMFENNDFSNQLINNLSMLKDNYTCNYFNENSFHKVIDHHNPKSLKIFHINIRSINKHKIILKSYIESLKCMFDIIFLTETGNTSINEIENIFQGYKFYLDSPILKKGSKGGAGILVNQNSFENIEELFENDEDNLKTNCQRRNCFVENKWLKLTSNKNTYITACIYRHPNGNIMTFIESLKKQLEKVDNISTCIIAGDINIDLLKIENVNVNRYMDLLLELNFIPCITIPTRLTETSATIIDHINIRLPTKKVSFKVSAGNLITDITDHLPNFIIMDEEINSIKNRPWIRLFNKKKHFEF